MVSGVEGSQTSLISTVPFLPEIKLRPRDLKSWLNFQCIRGRANARAPVCESHARPLRSSSLSHTRCPGTRPSVYGSVISRHWHLLFSLSGTTFPTFAHTVKSYLCFNAKITRDHPRESSLISLCYSTPPHLA